ncbi:complement component C9 [Seriola aureovittata]|uniref:complement component C9 n=1 Tax=Seriola aureovittata TaxID=2871759 RepID=UPI0024BD7825|nr:complement component C9 [Seriola aureovittata]
MRTALQLGFCGLCLTLALLGEGMGDENLAPAPVNCAWSRWSTWSPCDPCTRTRRRSRSVTVFGQFGGEPCQDAIGFAEACVATSECHTTQPTNCSASEFQCDTGSCIKMILKCNGDIDCEDGSDEQDCTLGRRPCGSALLDNNEQGRTAGYGINILGAAPRMNPFFNDYFNGQCNRVLNPDTKQYDRIPWNVGRLNYDTLVKETVSREIYESTHSLVRELLRENSFNLDAGLSFKFTPTEESMSKLSGNVDLSGGFGKKTMIKKVTEVTNIQNRSYMKVKGTVQLSTYRMRSRDLKLADEFLSHILSLPLEYEKGIYFAFIEDYGTHYTRNGKSGGEYELVYVLNHDAIKTRNLTERMVQECVKVGIGVGLSGTIEANANVKPEFCDNFTNKEEGNTHGKAVVDQVMTSVRGGTAHSASGMRAQLNKEGVMDLQTYQNWAQTIANAPALLSSESEPIYMLVPLDMPDANTRIANLRQATTDYIAEYNVCKCKPCHNGGTLTLVDGKCLCLCPLLYDGLACENFKADKAKNGGQKPVVNQEGNWSCWSAWNSCSGAKRTRTRQCNTDGISGAQCRGDTNHDEYC